MDEVILSTAYLGPVAYYSVIARAKVVFIEQYDSYHKQTYRNRCTILAANGPLDLVVPVVKRSGQKQLVKDTVIDYSTRWQAIHWQSICSAYNSSPFFEYFAEELVPFYQTKRKFLIDLNSELNLFVSEALGLGKQFLLTSGFQKETVEINDFRDAFLPKGKGEKYRKYYTAVAYSQTFGDKFGFVPDLSILDILFNVGPGSEELLLLQISETDL